MKNNIVVIILTSVWLAYFVWEYFVSEWAKSITTPIIRVDLIMIYPILFIITVIIIYILYKNYNKSM